MFPLIDSLVLGGIGILFITLEIVIMSFVIFWFGFATIITAILTHFEIITTFTEQIGSIAIISLVSMFLLRKYALDFVMKTREKDIKEDFLNEIGYGKITEGKVHFKATYWDFHSEDTFEEGEEVKVLETNNNTAKIEKIKK